MRRRQSPTGLAIAVLEDGRALVELLGDSYTQLAVAATVVEDATGNASILRSWAAGPLPASSRQDEALPYDSDTFMRGCVVYPLSAGSDLALFTDFPEQFLAGFSALFRGARAPAGTMPFPELFALELSKFLRRCRNKARARLAGGAYLDVLTAYLDELRGIRDVEDQNYYDRTFPQGIGAIMQDEKYLMLAEDLRARELYAALNREGSDLYQWHMNGARGNNTGPR